MAEPATHFDYVAIDETGRRVRGVAPAADERTAFDLLKRGGLSPVSIRPRRAGAEVATPGRARLGDRDLAELLFDLGALLAAGADIRTSLGVLANRSARSPLGAAVRAISAEISEGASLEVSIAKVLGARAAPIAALAAAGEASGDLAGSLSRAAAAISMRLELRGKLVSALSYPAFVLASTLVAVSVILLFVVPSLAPLASAPGVTPPLAMRLLLSASEVTRAHWGQMSGGLVGVALAGALGHRLGLLRGAIDRLWLDGPLGRTFSALTYGGFAVTLGELLTAGAPMSEALGLSVRTVTLERGRARLETCASAVRQGQRLSASLDRVRGFPPSIVRLAEIGEEAGALGAMLQRAGGLEQGAAIKRVEALSQVLSPILIVMLGALIGLLMAGLLTGVTSLGAAALN